MAKGGGKTVATPAGFQAGGNSGVGMGQGVGGAGKTGGKASKKKNPIPTKMGASAKSGKLKGPVGFQRGSGKGFSRGK